MDKISIIIPAYNAERYIKYCLESLINQTYKNLEIIVVNDGSTDSTAEIIKEYQKKDDRIVLVNTKNHGVSHARNIGIERATGEYIGFVDSDDWIEQTMYEEMIGLIKTKKCDIVRCNNFVNYSRDKNSAIGLYFGLSNRLLDESEIRGELLEKIMKYLPSYVVLLLGKASVIKEIKFDEKVRLLEDKLFYCKVLTKAKTVYCYDKPLYHYFINKFSVTNQNMKCEKYFFDILEFCKNLINILEKNGLYDEHMKKLIANIYITVFDRYLYDIYISNGIDDVKQYYAELNKEQTFKEMLNYYDVKFLKEQNLQYLFTTKVLLRNDFKKLKRKYNIYTYYKFVYELLLNIKVKIHDIYIVYKRR